MSPTGTDVIRLIGLGGVGRHGVLPEERRNGQLFKVDLVMHVDTRAAAESDDLEKTVDYAGVATDVVGVIEGEPVDLVETLAARVAAAVLARPAVHSVEVTVHKPEAPVGVPFDDVQVTIVRDRSVASAPAAPGALAEPVSAPVIEPDPAPVPPVAEPVAPVAAESRATDLDAEPEEPVEVVLGLGGNVGDVRATLRQAIDDLGTSGVLEIVDVAPLAKTAAVLQPDAVAQPDYLNTVVVARTSASPRAVLAVAHQVEQAHGRVRERRWGERTLDVDIITYGSVSSPDPELSLPHPRANERAFVLVPWAHMDPDAFLPGLGGGPVAALADTAPDRDGVRWLALDWYEQRPPQPSAPAPVASPDDDGEDVSTSRVDTGSSAAAQEPDLSRFARPADPDPEPEPEPVPAPEEMPEPALAPDPDEIPAPVPEPQPEEFPEPESVPGPQPASQPFAPGPTPEPLPEPAKTGDPWEQQSEGEGSQTRIRPRWEPIRRGDVEE